MGKVKSTDTCKPVLEVIACSVEDAIEAERGGADRLEVIRAFDRGGLTPPVDLVRDILAHVSLPVRVMLRERNDYAVESEDEIETLCVAARAFASLPVDGLVLGFLRERRVDVELMRRLLSCAPNLKATFHHAFEDTADQLEAIRTLKTFRQVDRVLTWGGAGDWSRRVERLEEHYYEASPEIHILLGGGVDAEVIELIGDATCVREFHAGRAARVPPRADGAVQAASVRELAQCLKAIAAND
jgi:copper homeostasis protein